MPTLSSLGQLRQLWEAGQGVKGEAGRRQGERGLQQGDIEEENQAACEEESDPLDAIEHFDQQGILGFNISSHACFHFLSSRKDTEQIPALTSAVN